MPKRFSYQTIKNLALVVSLVLTAFLLACQNAAEKNSEALKNDAQALAQLSRIDSSMSSTRSVSSENFKALKTIIEKYPHAPEAQRVYQTALALRGDWESLEKVLEAKPASEVTVDDRKLLVKVYFQLGKYQELVETATELTAVDPNDIDNRGLLAHAYLFLDRPDDADAQLAGVWEQIVAEKRTEQMTVRGLIYFRQNDLPKALEVLQSVVEINPSYGPAANALSQVHARLGNTERAEFYRQKVAEIQDKLLASERFGMQRVQQIYAIENAWKNKNYHEVIGLANEMLKAATEKNQKLTLYQYLVGSYEALGNIEAAQKALEEAQNIQKQQ